jgi:hypothetical protein
MPNQGKPGTSRPAVPAVLPVSGVGGGMWPRSFGIVLSTVPTVSTATILWSCLPLEILVSRLHQLRTELGMTDPLSSSKSGRTRDFVC